MTDQIPADAVWEAVTTPEVGLGDRVTFEAFGRRVLGTVTRCDKDGITIREESPYALSAAAPEPQSATTPKDTPMTDQMIPADKVREILATRSFLASEMIAEIEALLPPAPRPTLADMTTEERDECQWMQADIVGGDEPLVIARVGRGGGSALILDRNGRSDWAPDEDVTPRPDLPRLEWPGDKKPAPSLPDGWRLADHPEHGRVIVTTEKPGVDGDVELVHRADFLNSGYTVDWCKPDELTYIDQGADQ